MFDIANPNSWDILGNHPEFKESGYDEQWYEGDSNRDLLLLRHASICIIQENSNYTCKLVVLDDCTLFATFYDNETPVFDLCPAIDNDKGHPFYIDVLKNPQLQQTLSSEDDLMSFIKNL